MASEVTFNNSSKILPYSPYCALSCCGVYGVILPRSAKILTLKEIDKKIKNTLSHMNHLNGRLSHRNTDGGKKKRNRNISITDQILSASKRLDLLNLARNTIKPNKLSSVEFDICSVM